MAMICIWYPQEKDGGIDVKLLASNLGDSGSIMNHIAERMNVGHSSMLLDRMKYVAYISWWPQPAGEKTMSYKRDVEEEGRNPDAIINIDGLDEEKIGKWWKTTVSSRTGERGGYDFKSNNCSNTVAEALVLGGAESLVKKPSHVIWTPSRIANWATELASKSKHNGAVFRKEGIDTIITNVKRRMYSEVGATLMESL